MTPPSRSTIVVLAIAVLCLRPERAWAQLTDPHAVQPERPTVATHAGTVARGWIEVEFGGEIDRYSDSSRGGIVPVTTKIGLAPRVQLSLIASGTRPPGDGAFGVGDFGIGVKWRVADRAPILGRVAIQPGIKLPAGSAANGTGTGTTDASFLVISSRSLGPVALDINAGYTRRSGDGSTAPRHATLWTVSTGGPAAGRLGWVAELFGLPPTSGSSGADNVVAVLVGPTFAVQSWLALDVGVILPVTGPQPRSVYLGGVWNLGQAWQ